MGRFGEAMNVTGQNAQVCDTGDIEFDVGAFLSDAQSPEISDASLFVASGLRAAQSAPSSHRRMILTDLADVLCCSADELNFLFMEPSVAANDSDPVGMPDFRASLLAAVQ